MLKEAYVVAVPCCADMSLRFFRCFNFCSLLSNSESREYVQLMTRFTGRSSSRCRRGAKWVVEICEVTREQTCANEEPTSWCNHASMPEMSAASSDNDSLATWWQHELIGRVDTYYQSDLSIGAAKDFEDYFARKIRP